MTIRGQKDLEGLRRAGRTVAETLEIMKATLREGMTTRDLDAVGAEALQRLR